MKETTTPPLNDTPSRSSLEMLKRVLTVAELIAKSLPNETEEQGRRQKTPEKTQKE